MMMWTSVQEYGRNMSSSKQPLTSDTYCARKASLGLRQIFPARYAGCLSAFLPIKLSRLTAMNTESTKLFRFKTPQLPAGRL